MCFLLHQPSSRLTPLLVAFLIYPICNRFWDQINTEDIAICEKVQLGTAAAPYQGGRFSFRFEETLHRFQNMLADKLVGEERIPEGDPPELWRW